MFDGKFVRIGLKTEFGSNFLLHINRQQVVLAPREIVQGVSRPEEKIECLFRGLTLILAQ